MSTPVVLTPESVHKVLGSEATQELVGFVNQVAAAASSTKVDRVEYDAHAQLIATQFKAQNDLAAERDKSLRAEIKSQTRGALLAGLAWATVLIAGLFGALYAVVG